MPDSILLLDIGTTTISADIIDSNKNKLLASGSILNSQAAIGDDIISRIEFSLKSRQNAAILQGKVAGSVNRLAKKLCRENNISANRIKKVLCACNSAMHHIFLGLDTSPLITPPYNIKQKTEMSVYSNMIGVNIRKNLKITFLPNMGGFVGSDALCAILSSGIYKARDLCAIIDMGTNGEIVLGNKNKILVASTAAGPAFEARHIKYGMPAVQGAISGVKIKNKTVHLDVIGKKSPKGIAGSGLIDACFELYRNSFVDCSGRMRQEEFILYKKGKKKISITQSDIRKIQLAKGAILAGMKVLLRRYKANSDSINKVILTGSFGGCLNAKSVIGIGLVPKMHTSKVRYIEKAVLKGLRLWEREKSIQDNIFSIISKVEHVPLFGKAFGKEFANSLSLC